MTGFKLLWLQIMKKTYLSEKGSGKDGREEKRMISRKMDGLIYNAMSVSLEGLKHQVRHGKKNLCGH